ncbi:ROK family protein [Mesoplasma chauliocola]|uniref:ROK family protein n=1 Tax=Mesoplasma chauliocola TaxID=216427 RepID=A0A249SMC2_9MOLU|nr:ROK family protein [Mesoplasma chauliocola]ASZ08770.1 ROK family protein [Mesoplasma chauliocola]
MLNYTFDIGGTGIKCIVFENDKEIKEYHVDTKSNPDQMGKTKLIEVLEKISEILNNEKQEFNLAIAVPGPVDPYKRKILAESSMCEVNINLEEYFSRFKNMKKFILHNDAKAAAYGEFLERKKTLKIENMAHLTIGTAIGCGLIINERIFDGKNFRAGEVGKMRSNIYGNDGFTVTLDTGLGTLLFKHQYFTKCETKLTGFELFEKYNNKDPLCVQLVDEWISQLSKFIINLDFCLDLDLITLGGAISSNNQFVSMLNEAISKNKSFEWEGRKFDTNEEIENKFEISLLKNKAACYGGLGLLKIN